MTVFDETTPTQEKIYYYVGRGLPFVTTLSGIVLALIFGSH
ncbi:hypothetical protein ACFZDK_53565 [Streptomyces sp. NPDC007901]